MNDKLLHFIGCAIGANFMMLSGLSPLSAFSVMIVIAAIKETKDDNTMPEHIKDMIANTIGSLTVFVWSLA